MPKHALLTATLMLGLCTLPACATAGRAVVGTVGTAAKTTISTAGTATRVAARAAGAAGNVAIDAASTGQRTAATATTGAANGAAREGGKLAVRGIASAGQAGFRAMTADDSSVSEDVLAHRAGLAMNYPREEMTIGNVFQTGARTDFLAVSPQGQAANCYVMQESGTVSNAACQAVAE